MKPAAYSVPRNRTLWSNAGRGISHATACINALTRFRDRTDACNMVL